MSGLKSIGNGVSKVAQKTGKVGGQYKNKLAVTHGCYVSIIDGRTRQAKAIQQVQAELTAALGNDPSPQEILIIQRASVKALKCALIEAEMMRNNGDTSEGLTNLYLRFSRELRSDLLALGLKRRQTNVTDLQDYLKENYGGE